MKVVALPGVPPTLMLDVALPYCFSALYLLCVLLCLVEVEGALTGAKCLHVCTGFKNKHHFVYLPIACAFSPINNPLS